MRRVMLLALSVLMVVSMAVSPAFAHGDRRDGHRHHNNDDACFVVVFVPFGFWDLDWFGNWFWRDLSRFECR